MQLDYLLLGHSGPHVSPLSPGAVTLGKTPGGWRCDAAAAEGITRANTEAADNFMDAAEVYRAGDSERIVGRTLAAASLREQMVIATKYSFDSGAKEIDARVRPKRLETTMGRFPGWHTSRAGFRR